MDSKEEAGADGHNHNTATENSDGANTFALQRKRARRVSFAEMTSIHFFDRDEEDNATPPVETEKIGDNSVSDVGSGGRPELLKEFEGGDDDNNDDGDDDEMEMRRSFLRPVGSPSPGGSTFGSASSNDEDNFFGPVSANFIRPGRLSDAASDDNHECTMDSTAFSMHFRSLATSDSGVDLKTPTGGQLLFEEKTPTEVGSSMIFTRGKNVTVKPSLAVTEVSGKNDTDDMSLVEYNHKKYDYEKLSPGLDALLAESRSNLLSVSVSNDIIASTEVLPITNHVDILMNGVVSANCMVTDGANGPLRTFLNERSPRKFFSSASDKASNTVAYRSNRSPYQLSKESPLVNATSPVKQQQVLPTITSPSRHLVMTTPLLGQPASLTESKKHHGSEASIQKSISKLELLEKSASSAFSIKVDKSTIRSLDFLRSPNFDALLDTSRHVSKFHLVEDSLAEERLKSVNHSKENKDAFILDGVRSGTPNPVSGENHLEESLGHTLNEILPNGLEYRRDANSSEKVTGSGNNIVRSLLTSKHSSEDTLMTETDSLLTKIIGGGKEIVTPLKLVSSPNILLEEEISASPGLQSNQFSDFLLQNQFNDFPKFDKGGDSTAEMNLVDASLSTPSAGKDAVSMGMKGIQNFGFTRSPDFEARHHKNLIEVKEIGTREVDSYTEKQIVGTVDNYITPDKGKTLQILHSKIQDAGNQMLKELHDRNMTVFRTSSSLGKEFDNEQVPSVRTPKSIQLSGKLEKRSANKRNLELLLQDTQDRTETAIIQRSPKQQKSGISAPDPDPLSLRNQGSKETTVTAYERNQWTDIYSKFSEDTNQLIPCSASALSSNMIDVLEDILVHRQRSKAYEVLCSGLQNATVHHDLRLERTAETNSLLYQIMIEKAKLQLKHVKRERLLKKLELLGTRIQESQVLKANISSHQLKTNSCNLLVGQNSLPVNLVIERQRAADTAPVSVILKAFCRTGCFHAAKMQQDVLHVLKVFPEKLTAVKQELEAIDRKILNLKRTLHANCKIKAEPSSDTISLVNEHLTKCAHRRFIHLDMQMWVIHSISTENGQHNVVLNYLDLMIQSIKVTVGPTLSTSTSFKLNETNIVKNFPNIDACKAFASVFNVQTTRKYVGAKTLPLETQVTGSLLGTLLDVIEEVQSAQMEFSNLIQSSFCLPSVEQLDLVLCFFNFNTGRKVALTLDLSCLKRGIYPSDILPLQLSSHNDTRQDFFCEIRDAVKGIRSGYRRILRICRCVSQVVQDSRS